MSQDIKEVIRKEYIKCASDPAYFIKKFVYISHPIRGRILFALYPFQEKVLQRWQENDFTIILKSRQLGISTLAAAFALWLMIFHKDKNIICLATKQDVAKNMVTKVKFAYEGLPSWLKVDFEEMNKLSLKLVNGSIIKATSAASDSARSEAASLLIIDEAAFIEGVEPIWASAQQTLATGGGAIVLSTPNGTGNWFHKTWVKAENKEKGNSFFPIRLPWQVHPERNQAWRDKQDDELGDKRIAAQECDCDFNTSGHTFFPAEHIDFYEKTYIKDPIEIRGEDNSLWIWERADGGRTYTVIADVARGNGEDYSAFSIYDIETNTQVAEYKGQIATREFGKLLYLIATEYNDALLVIENSSIGWDTIGTVIDKGYRNLYYSPKSGNVDADSYFNNNTGDMVPGFTNSLKTRPLMLNKLREYISDHAVIIHSKRTLEEMKVFIWKNGRPEAQSGYNDDLVVCSGISMYLRDTSFRFKSVNEDTSRAILNNIQVNRNSNHSGVYSSKFIRNPYDMDLGNGHREDIRWLFNNNE